MYIKDMIDRIAIQNAPIAFSVKYWDGEQRKYGNGTSTFAVSFNDESTCRDLFSNISLRFGEAYESGAIDVDGDFQAFLSFLYSVNLADLSLNPVDKCKVLLRAWRQRNTRKGVRRNVRGHYDLGNDFYSMWLGEGMHYSCAYFRDMSDDIALAQTQKCEHICRKLHLRPGDTLLDIGCGWGAFAIYAAKRFGARVVGITLSAEQQREAEHRVKQQRLEECVEIRLLDYRAMPKDSVFDRIVSIGMFEHVGRKHIGEYMLHTARMLKQGGIGVLHTIGRWEAAGTDPWLAKYIFPGVYFPSLTQIVESMTKEDLRIHDVESLRDHYELTLARWAEAYERVARDVDRLYGREFVRRWRLYLESARASFRYGKLNVWQIQYTHGRNNGLPLTREYLCNCNSTTGA